MTIALSMVTLLGAACGGSPDSSAGSGGSGSGSGSASSGDVFGGGLDPVESSSAGGIGSGDSTGAGEACATQSSKAELQPVYLAFAFDVSGSMGQNDQPWHDKSLKWDPIVRATKEFFSDPGAAGLTASLTFFPAANQRRMCSGDTYSRPDVEMTPLPSTAFAEAIDAVTPGPRERWRTGTPTAFVVEGTTTFIEQERQRNPGKYVIVLVTDGYPQLCSNGADTIEAVVQRVERARASNIATYVVGVANPPVEGAPENVENLKEIAAAGGTGDAFIIDTGNPEETAATFRTAIDQIRGSAVSCTLPIPPAPDGRTFDKQKVNVTYTSGSGTPMNLVYDQECETASGWRYDNPANPTQIVLCEDACSMVQSDPDASLGVDFTCEDVIVVPL